MAELNQNLIYLVVSFFGLAVIGFIYLVVINGNVLPAFQNLVTSGNLIPMDTGTTNSVLGGFNQIDFMLKILIPGLFVAALVAVFVFILFRKEEESYQQ